MTKILGVVFQSTIQPHKLAQSIDVVDDFQQGMTKATEAVAKEQGLLGWAPIITTFREMPTPIVATPAPTIVETLQQTTTQSWLMKTIIDNKDLELFNASEKYLSVHELEYIKDKVK